MQAETSPWTRHVRLSITREGTPPVRQTSAGQFKWQTGQRDVVRLSNSSLKANFIGVSQSLPYIPEKEYRHKRQPRRWNKEYHAGLIVPDLLNKFLPKQNPRPMRPQREGKRIQGQHDRLSRAMSLPERPGMQARIQPNSGICPCLLSEKRVPRPLAKSAGRTGSLWPFCPTSIDGSVGSSFVYMQKFQF